MPGIRILALEKPGNIESFWEDVSGAVRNKEAVFVDLYYSSDIRVGISYRDFYPYRVIDGLNYRIIIDGIVYSPDEVASDLYLGKIAERFVDGEDVVSLVRDFVDRADGDFVITVHDKKCCRFIIFNDRLGRLATYYYYDKEMAVISREIKSILALCSTIEKDVNSLVEYLSLGYPLGTKTLFKGVKRLAPSEAILLDMSKSGTELISRKTCDFNFILQQPLETSEDSLELLSGQFLDAVKQRISYANRIGYPIIADLSGGFDTRAILGGLSHFSKNVQYVTIKLATGDETKEAEAVFMAMGKPGSFSTIQVNHDYSEEEISQYLLDTDGLVNYYTTIVCSKDIEALYSLIGNTPAFRFCGLGGEFIRHPNKKFFGSLLKGYKRGLYSGSVDRICRFLSVNPVDYFDSVGDYLSSYPEKTPQDQLRRWYYEYYLNFVDHAAEDRERSVLWTVQPLWSNPFTRTIFNRIPLNWTGYEYFTRFLEKIDARLLTTSIFKKDLILSSQESLQRYDKNENLKIKKRIIKSALPMLDRIRKKITERSSKTTESGNMNSEDFLRLVKRNPGSSKICDIDLCYSHLVHNVDTIFYRRIKTLIIYFEEQVKNI